MFQMSVSLSLCLCVFACLLAGCDLPPGCCFCDELIQTAVTPSVRVLTQIPQRSRCTAGQDARPESRAAAAKTRRAPRSLCTPGIRLNGGWSSARPPAAGRRVTAGGNPVQEDPRCVTSSGSTNAVIYVWPCAGKKSH